MGRVNHSLVKLGARLPSGPPDSRNLRLEKYLPVGVPVPPSTYDWYKRVSRWGPMGNLTIGDCVVAGAGHRIQTWTANQGKEVIIPDAEIISIYSQLSGYDPATGANDNGLDLEAFLKYWQQTGIAGHKIGAYVFIDPTNQLHRWLGSYAFGGLYCGVALPLSAKGQQFWDVTDPKLTGDAEPGSWGGHCLDEGIYDHLSAVFSTWGEEQGASNAFIAAYFFLVAAIISQDFLDGKEDNPLGINLSSLNQDLQAVTS